MLINEMKITLRQFWRNRAYSAINLLGLGLGLAFALLAFLFISEELQFDRFNNNADRIVLLQQWETPPDRDPFGSIATPLGLAGSLNANFPEVEKAAKVLWWNATVNLGETTSNELLYYVDPQFFDIFSFAPLYGDPASAIKKSSNIILTASTADRFFGETNVVGRKLEIQIGEEMQPVTVGAVLKDPPATSTLQFGLLVTAERLHEFMPERAFDAWQWVHPYTFALLSKGTTVDQFRAALPRLAQLHNFDERYGKGELHYKAIPWVDFHLKSTMSDGLLQPSRPEYLWGIGIVGLLILLVAAVNYTTISIASSTRRVGEVGVRLVLGAGKSRLRTRLLLESILITALAVPVALLIVELVLPSFSQIVDRELQFAFNLPLILMTALLVVLLGVIAGFYPALLMSRLSPVRILKGRETPRSSRYLLRGLVIAQFTVAVALICGSWMIGKQIQFMIDQQIAGRGNQVLSVFMPVQPQEKQEQFVTRVENALRAVPGVESIAASSNTLGWPWGWFGFQDEKGAYRSFNGNMVDPGYIPTHKLNLIAGRNFEPNNHDDEVNGVIVNQAAVQAFGWSDPIGQPLPVPYNDFHVIGVVGDFHYLSLHDQIGPLLLFENGRKMRDLAMDINNFSGYHNFLQLRLSAENMKQTLAHVQDTYDRVTNGQPYQSVFVDDIVRGMYAPDIAVRNTMVRATGLTLLIALMGILGLASLSVAQRRREITIRKVLGATLADIQGLMAKEFALLIAIASFIAWPLAYFGVRAWLSTYAYRTSIDLSVFLMLALAIFITALLVVGSQSLRAALVNPAETLRDE